MLKEILKSIGILVLIILLIVTVGVIYLNSISQPEFKYIEFYTQDSVDRWIKQNSGDLISWHITYAKLYRDGIPVFAITYETNKGR